MLECSNVTPGEEKIKRTVSFVFCCCSTDVSVVSIIEQVGLLSLLALALCSACLHRSLAVSLLPRLLGLLFLIAVRHKSPMWTSAILH